MVAPQIHEVVDEFVEAYNDGDVDGLMRAFAADFVDMSDGEPTLRGEQAHAETVSRLRDTFAKFTGRLTVQVEETETAGDWAYDWGTLRVELTPKGAGDPVVVERRFLEIWRRERDGHWRVLRSMDNSAGSSRGATLDFRSK